MTSLLVTIEEQATILAALRHWQRTLNGPTASHCLLEWDIATNDGTVEPLDEYSIDLLCDKVNP